MISSDARGIALRDFRTVTIPESAHLITWRVGDQGFEMHLSGEVPQRLAKALDAERLRNDRDGILRGEDRKSAETGKSVSVRVALGGRRLITKKQNHSNTIMKNACDT